MPIIMSDYERKQLKEYDEQKKKDRKAFIEANRKKIAENKAKAVKIFVDADFFNAFLLDERFEVSDLKPVLNELLNVKIKNNLLLDYFAKRLPELRKIEENAEIKIEDKPVKKKNKKVKEEVTVVEEVVETLVIEDVETNASAINKFRTKIQTEKEPVEPDVNVFENLNEPKGENK